MLGAAPGAGLRAAVTEDPPSPPGGSRWVGGTDVEGNLQSTSWGVTCPREPGQELGQSQAALGGERVVPDTSGDTLVLAYSCVAPHMQHVNITEQLQPVSRASHYPLGSLQAGLGSRKTRTPPRAALTGQPVPRPHLHSCPAAAIL